MRIFAAVLLAVSLAAPAWADFVVVIDAGHGGRDPGAQAEGLEEANLTLAVALRLAADLEDRGVTVRLTREADTYVDLETRVTLAQEAQADALVSLHADALAEGRASGLSVYTLLQGAGEALDARRVARHGGAALLSGMDLGDAGDDIALALMDIARRDAAPASAALSSAVVEAVAEAGLPLFRRPEQADAFAILAAPDIPSILVELGYISTKSDRARLTSYEGQAALAAALADGIEAWWRESGSQEQR